MSSDEEEDAVELDNLSDMDSAPDSPLLSPTSSTQPQPKWMLPRRPRPEWLSSLGTWLLTALKPRYSWKYAVCTAAVGYVLLCTIRGVPLFASSLPRYSGQYGVGAVDLEVPLDKPRRISNTTMKSTGLPAFELETVLMTVYYPIAKGYKSRHPHHLWIPRPVSVTSEGYATFAHVNNFLIRPIFTFALWMIAGGIEIPSEVDAPLLAASTTRDASDGGEDGKFPLMVFSHGMASSRTDYTHYIGELASRGYVIAALEHRDGSCPGSIVKIRGKKDRRVIHFREGDLVSEPAMDTTRIKKEQLAFRDAEMFEAISILTAINDGKGDDVYKSSSRGEGATIADWRGRLDFSHLLIGGHSYGATGALQALKEAPSSSNPAVGGIVLDPGKESGPLNAVIDVPILVVHSNTWSKTRSMFFGRPHFDTVRDLVQDVLNRTGAAWFLTSLGTSHPSVSDAPLLEPFLLSWTTSARMNVKEGLEEYVKISADFFHFVTTNETRGMLAQTITHTEYDRWANDERRNSYPKQLARLWQVHVSPAPFGN